MLKKHLALVFFLSMLFLFFRPSWALPLPSHPEDFVKAFYAEFYKGYYEALDQKKKDPYPRKLIQTKRYFDNRLYSLLQKEHQRSKTAKEICGVLDFDPFMSAQDDAGPVKSTQLIQNGSKTQVKVTFANFGGNHSVLMDLKKEAGNWKIVNFIYAPDRDLIEKLKMLEKEKCQ